MENISITMREKKKNMLIIESDGVTTIVEEVSEDEVQVKVSDYLRSTRRLDDKK